MELVWTRSVTWIRGTFDQFGPMLADVWMGLGPWRWAIAAVVGVLVALWIGSAVARAVRRAGGPPPSLLLTRGTIRFLDVPRDPQTGERIDRFGLRAALANLGDVPVSIVELVIRSEYAPDPVVLERTETLAPHGSVELVADVVGLAGDRGALEVYVSTAAPRPGGRPRLWRLEGELTWEAWNARYRVEPLRQRVRPVRDLPSSRQAVLDRSSWRRRQEALRSEAEDASAPVRAPGPEPASTRERDVAPNPSVDAAAVASASADVARAGTEAPKPAASETHAAMPRATKPRIPAPDRESDVAPPREPRLESNGGAEATPPHDAEASETVAPLDAADLRLDLDGAEPEAAADPPTQPALLDPSDLPPRVDDVLADLRDAVPDAVVEAPTTPPAEAPPEPPDMAAPRTDAADVYYIRERVDLEELSGAEDSDADAPREGASETDASAEAEPPPTPRARPRLEFPDDF